MKTKYILILIFILGFLLRFWQLGSNPPSLDWDEASLGYNAYSILKTGRDEYGTFLPLSIRSFGDYKPPLYTYLTILPVALFGLNEFSTRFISAVLGSLSVIVGYFLIKELFFGKKPIFYLLFSTFFALSPWHIQFSRIAFEANTALFFFIAGIWLFLKGLKRGTYFLFSVISFSLSFYAYHSPRLVVPLLLVGMFFIYKETILKQKKIILLSLFLFGVLISPIVYQLRSTGARFSSVTVINQDEKLGESIKAIEFDQKTGDILGKLMHNRRIVYTKEILGGYLDHFNFDFLFLTGDPPGRHHAVGMGMLYFWDLPFLILGVIYLVRNSFRNKNLLFWWFIVAPTASSLTSGTPHAVRALFYLPTFQMFIAFGIVFFFTLVKSHIKGFLQKSILIVTFSLLIFNVFYYLHMYWRHTPYEDSASWQYGYREVVSEVSKYEDKYDKIVVTYRYDQPYIYFLFYNKIDPLWYQRQWKDREIKRAERSFGKYEFRNLDLGKDSGENRVLFVGTPSEIPESTPGILKTVFFLDGSVAFRIVGR